MINKNCNWVGQRIDDSGDWRIRLDSEKRWSGDRVLTTSRWTSESGGWTRRSRHPSASAVIRSAAGDRSGHLADRWAAVSAGRGRTTGEVAIAGQRWGRRRSGWRAEVRRCHPHLSWSLPRCRACGRDVSPSGGCWVPVGRPADGGSSALRNWGTASSALVSKRTTWRAAGSAAPPRWDWWRFRRRFRLSFRIHPGRRWPVKLHDWNPSTPADDADIGCLGTRWPDVDHLDPSSIQFESWATIIIRQLTVDLT